MRGTMNCSLRLDDFLYFMLGKWRVTYPQALLDAGIPLLPAEIPTLGDSSKSMSSIRGFLEEKRRRRCMQMYADRFDPRSRIKNYTTQHGLLKAQYEDAQRHYGVVESMITTKTTLACKGTREVEEEAEEFAR